MFPTSGSSTESSPGASSVCSLSEELRAALDVPVDGSVSLAAGSLVLAVAFSSLSYLPFIKLIPPSKPIRSQPLETMPVTFAASSLSR